MCDNVSEGRLSAIVDLKTAVRILAALNQIQVINLREKQIVAGSAGV